MEMTPTHPTIRLNGSPREIPSAMTLDSLLAHLGLSGKPVVVELNESAVFPREYATTTVSNGDRIEIVTLAAGG